MCTCHNTVHTCEQFPPDRVLHLPAHTESLPRLEGASLPRLSLVLHGRHGGRLLPHVAWPTHPADCRPVLIACQECPSNILHTCLFSQSGDKTDWDTQTHNLTTHAPQQERKESFHKIWRNNKNFLLINLTTDKFHHKFLSQSHSLIEINQLIYFLYTSDCFCNKLQWITVNSCPNCQHSHFILILLLFQILKIKALYD